MRSVLFLGVVAMATAAPGVAAAQLPPGYWSFYDSDSKSHHRQHAQGQLQHHASSPRGAQEPWADRGPVADPMGYQGRGMTGRGLSAYQSNGYSGPNQSLYYGYWDGGFQGGSAYGYSMYPHFDRPGFTYWQY
ncbi:MAG TPA: hypothetical protein VFI31_06135 [Pirellulales bacterium]|nr:hypothetical protein [Pirellulales bacterium]